MKLSPHFELNEFINSQTAARHGIDNTPPPEILENLKRLAILMEEVRGIFGKPIRISSGYRCQELNRMVGGSMSSQHTKGQACDFTVVGMALDDVVEDIIAEGIRFDQLIKEFDDGKGGGWVHISIATKDGYERKQALIIDRNGTRLYA